MSESAGRVLGIGGVFFRAAEPVALRAWYEEHLGIEDSGWGHVFEDNGPCVWSPFDADTDYFGSPEQAFMLNYRVDDLDALLAKLRKAGVEVGPEVQESEQGRFSWAVDPAGRRLELWQPSS